jgi:uncharacterized protein (TIGR02145 family)
MKKAKLALVAMAGIFFVCGCKEEAAAKSSSTDQTDGKEETVAKGSFTDPRDGKKYKYVKIADQTWMAQNLDYGGKNNDIGKCYNNKAENCKKCGTLYTMDEAKEACPSGWHLPSAEEWQTLAFFAGGEEYGAGIAGKKLKTKSGWTPSKEDIKTGDMELQFMENALEAEKKGSKQKVYLEQAIKAKWEAYDYKCKYTTKETTARGEVIVTEHDECATDEFGFSALPCGAVTSNGFYVEANIQGNWWMSSAIESQDAYSNPFNSYVLSLGYNRADMSVEERISAASIRCIKNGAAQGSFTDTRDGKNYKYAKIGKQTWMAENLNYDTESSKCYDNKPENCQKYGRLYDWNTAMKSCPEGWHLPSKDEWDKLYRFADGTSGTKPYNSGTAGKLLKSAIGWNDNGNGTDAFGFTALSGGYRMPDGSFTSVGYSGGWWSASEINASQAYSRGICFNYEETCWNDNDPKDVLFSVRCLQD